MKTLHASPIKAIRPLTGMGRIRPRPAGKSRLTTAAQARTWFATIALLALSAWQSIAFAADPYTIDPAFPWQGFNPNNFSVSATLPNQSSAGKKIATLSDGTLVAASLVKKLDGSQTNAYWNIGLTRYDPVSGLALPWPNLPPAYAGIKPWDIVYPNVSNARFSWIQDIKVIDGRILVVANRAYEQDESDVDVRVVVFGEDGSFKSNNTVFGTTAAEYVGGMEVYQTVTNVGQQIVRTNHVVVAATKSGNPPRPLFRRYELTAAGTLEDKTGVVNLNTHYCANTQLDCQPAGVALGAQVLQDVPPKIYVLNRVFEAGTGYFSVTRVNQNGVADATWDSRRVRGNAASSIVANAIAVRTAGAEEQIYVASNRTHSCRDGMEIDSLTSTGVIDQYIDVGGSDESNPTICAMLSTSYSTALAIDGDRLALAGFDERLGPIGATETDVDATLSIVDISNAGLTLQNKQVFGYEDATTRYAHSGAWGVVATSGGRFVLAGDGRYFATETDGSAGKTFSFILGLMPNDRIFASGFEAQ